MWVHGMDRSIFLRLASLVVAAATMASAWADQKSASAGIQQKTSPTTISVGAPDQHNLLIYQYGEVPYKPYVKELRTPGGVQVLRDSPWDHKHHHALMFAVGINGVDFWSENPHCGTQVHRQFSPRSGSTGDNNSFRENLDWISPEKQILAKEVRSISFQRGPAGGANLVTWKTQLEGFRARHPLSSAVPTTSAWAYVLSCPWTRVGSISTRPARMGKSCTAQRSSRGRTGRRIPATPTAIRSPWRSLTARTILGARRSCSR